MKLMHDYQLVYLLVHHGLIPLKKTDILRLNIRERETKHTDNFRTRKLFVGSPRTKLIASIRFDLPKR